MVISILGVVPCLRVFREQIHKTGNYLHELNGSVNNDFILFEVDRYCQRIRALQRNFKTGYIFAVKRFVRDFIGLVKFQIRISFFAVVISREFQHIIVFIFRQCYIRQFGIVFREYNIPKVYPGTVRFYEFSIDGSS